MLADSKKSRTFASLLKRSTSERKSWRDGRVVDRGGLENRCTERYRLSIAAVLKTVVLRGTGGSNPSLSAK